jgi:uncharacterized protein (DUF1800 family)
MADSALAPLDKLDPNDAWQPWQPDDKQPWDLKWAGHLYRRATFGASHTELQDAVKRGLPATLDLLLQGDAKAAAFDATLARLGKTIAGRENAHELRGWWLYRMLHSPYPLREKMTLFWHNHFATSVVKVASTVLMAQQNELLRKHALGKFRPFLLEMSQDPAMLVWLDSNGNVKGKPNENYARELMELFSLGVGHYTEKDIREAARAFTGWHTDNDAFAFRADEHDGGPKTVLGQSGNWDGGDVVRIVLEQPATPLFLVRKLYHFLVSENAQPSDAFLQPLADGLRKSDFDLALVLRAILQSRHFYSAHAFRQRIKSPVEFALGAAIAAVPARPIPVPPEAMVDRLEAMGQVLFAPPNVKGWPGGKAWLNTSTVLARHNFAEGVTAGTAWKVQPRRGRNEFEEPETVEKDSVEKPKKTQPPPDTKWDVAELVKKEKVTEPAAIVDLLTNVFLPGGVSPAVRDKLVNYVADGKPQGEALDWRVRETAHAIMTLPEYELA